MFKKVINNIYFLTMKKPNARSALRDFNGARTMAGISGAASNGGYGGYGRTIGGTPGPSAAH